MNVAILGASSHLERYSNKAQLRLMEEGHTVFPISIKDESIHGVKAYPNLASVFEQIDTLTVYVNPANLEDLVDDIVDLNPRRVIFNPGTEDSDIQNRLSKAGIHVQVACTLVLLNTNQFEDKKESV